MEMHIALLLAWRGADLIIVVILFLSLRRPAWALCQCQEALISSLAGFNTALLVFKKCLPELSGLSSVSGELLTGTCGFENGPGDTW